MADYKAGDTIRLKSGGPPMTVEKIESDATGKPRAYCTWFDDNGALKHASFEPGMLKPDDGMPRIG